MHKYYEWHWQSSYSYKASPGPFSPEMEKRGERLIECTSLIINGKTKAFLWLSFRLSFQVSDAAEECTNVVPSSLYTFFNEKHVTLGLGDVP